MNSNDRKDTRHSYSGLVVVLHNRFAYHLANGIGFVKIATLVFISITGFVVLGGHTRIENPTANFHNSFEGKATAYGITNGLYKIIFSYSGFENAFNVANEVKVSFLWMGLSTHWFIFLHFLVEPCETDPTARLHCHLVCQHSLHSHRHRFLCRE